MTARRVRRTARSAGLVAVAAVAALSLTACQGGSDADAAPEKQASSSASSSPSSADPSGDSDASSGAGSDTTDKGDGKAEGGTAAATSADSDSAKAASPIRTQTLPDGSKAEIYQLGSQKYRAKIINDGDVLATLDTNGHDAGLDANDMFLVLTLGGDLHAWMGGGHQGPGTFKLAGGWTAKVTKSSGQLNYRAQILGNEGEVDATLDTNGHDVGLDANGVYIVLSNGGIVSAHQ